MRGANVGQTVERFRHAFDRPEIHSFEPSPATFQALGAGYRAFPASA